jgi:Ca2+-binding RTX toxin-like protein
MTLVIAQHGPFAFDLFSPVEALLNAHGYGPTDAPVSWIILELDPNMDVFLEGVNLELGEDGRLVSGIVTSFSINQKSFFPGYVIFSNLSLDVSEARLAPLGQYPLAEYSTINYSAADFSPSNYGPDYPLNIGVNFTAGSGNDTLRGSSIDDTFRAGGGDDRVNSGDGSDWVLFDTGKDTLDGGKGFDFLDYSAVTKSVSVKLTAGKFATVKIGGVAQDQIANFEGLLGGTKSDKLIGDSRSNTFMGAAGKDTLDGGDGIDAVYYSDKDKPVVVTLKGSAFVSVKVGGNVEDVIRNIEQVTGGSAGDTLTGDSRHNVLTGLGGKDTLSGGSGNDLLIGGAGKDFLRGGDGHDEFRFDVRASAGNADVIADFQNGVDVIVLDASVFTAFPGEGRSISGDQICVGTSAIDHDDNLIYDPRSDRVWYDPDGRGGHPQQLLFTFGEHPRHLDFYLSFIVL